MASIRYCYGDTWEVTISLGCDATGSRERVFTTIEVPGSEKYNEQIMEIQDLSKQKRKAAPDDKPVIEIRIQQLLKDEKLKKLFEKAKARAAVLENKYREEGQKKPTKDSFDDIFNKYLASHQGERALSVKTESRYQQMYDLRIKDYFAPYKLEKITALVIDDFFTKLRQTGRLDGREGNLSEQSIKHHWRLLYSVFNWAYEKDIIPKNPMIKAEKVLVDAKEPESYDQAQADRLFDVLENAELKFKAITYLALDSGCRLGELVGLTWDNVNFDKGQIKIIQAAQYISEIGKSINIDDILKKYPNTPEDLFERRIVITPPKTKKSNRTINISPSVLKILQAWKHEQNQQHIALANKWKKDSIWVFTDSFGDLINPNIPSKWLHRLLTDNNLPKLRFHGLRHSCASLLLAQGQDIAAISRRLGHSNTNTTTRIYIHSSDTQDQESAAKMEGIFNRKQKAAKAK